VNFRKGFRPKSNKYSWNELSNACRIMLLVMFSQKSQWPDCGHLFMRRTIYHCKVPATKRRVWQSEGDHYCAFMLQAFEKRYRGHEKEISHPRASFWLLSRWIPALNSSGHSWIALRVKFFELTLYVRMFLLREKENVLCILLHTEYQAISSN